MGSNKKRRPKKEAFLAAYATCGNVTAAAEAAGCNRNTHYKWLEEDAEYPARFAQAEAEAVERMEAEADRRALQGVQEPVFYEGKVCGYKQRYSDNLLMFRLKALRPEKYRERSEVQHGGKIGTTARVLEDDDWYKNAHRFRDVAAADGPSGNGPEGSGPAQVRGVRPEVGKNGHGAAGNGEGPRP